MSERQGWDPGDERDAVLPEQTSDDTDRGWGEHTEDLDHDDDADAADDIERLIREKPPHW